MKDYRVKFLTHTKISGKMLDGSDSQFSKGKITEVTLTHFSAMLKDHTIYSLARTKIPHLVISKNISIDK